MIDVSARRFILLILSEFSSIILGPCHSFCFAIRYGRPRPRVRWPGRRPHNAGFQPGLHEHRAAVRQIARCVERG